MTDDEGRRGRAPPETGLFDWAGPPTITIRGCDTERGGREAATGRAEDIRATWEEGVNATYTSDLDVLCQYNLRPMLSHMALKGDIASTPSHALALKPQIEDEEFARMLNDLPDNGYFAQSRGSVFLRMGLVAPILGA